jgi:hypothetical protein
MSVSSIATFGSAAIATPPTNDANKRDERAETTPPVQAARAPGTGQSVDKIA